MIPTLPAIVKEAVTVLAGAVLAAYIIGQLPEVKAWVKKQWA